jgi:6-phosphogluconolactonase
MSRSSLEPHHGSLLVLDDAAAVAEAARQAFCDLVASTAAAERPLRVALSGGSTPRRLYALLAESDLPWDRIEWFWGDERNVPHEDSESNYRMVREQLLSVAPIPPGRVHPVPIEVADPAAAARAYEQTLAEAFQLPNDDSASQPRFDLVLLGLGDDAHTASLFPETAALRATDRWYVENWVAKFASHRLTLTAPVINAARQVWFLITGENKRDALGQVWAGPRDPERFPAQLIAPEDGVLRWIVSREALPYGTRAAAGSE